LRFSPKWLLGLAPVVLIVAGVILWRFGVLGSGGSSVSQKGSVANESSATIPEKIVSAFGGVTEKAVSGLSGATKQAGKVVRSVQDKASHVGDRVKSAPMKDVNKSVVKQPKPAVKRLKPKKESANPKPRRIVGTKPGGILRPLGGEREVVSGDSLRRIAKQQYGNEMLWPLIWEFNKERARRAGQKMDDPDLIFPGWTFLIPGREAAKPALATRLPMPTRLGSSFKGRRPMPESQKLKARHGQLPSRAHLAGIVSVLVVLALSLAACGSRSTPTPMATATPTAPPAQAKKSPYPLAITYRITGSAKQANVIYLEYTPTEGRAKRASVALPRTYTFGTQVGEYVYISGLPADPQSVLSCEISIDGTRLRKDTVADPQSVASCTATLRAK